MYSFWEKKELVNFDCIIIGSGITGLSTAISLAEKNNALRIAVLERGLLPTGASTKNAGFACFGSLSEIVADCEEYGEEVTFDLMLKRYEGLQMLRERFDDREIDLHVKGGYELFSDTEMQHLEKLAWLNNKCDDFFGFNVYQLCSKTLINSFGFSSRHIRQIVKNTLEGQLDTGKLANALLRKAASLGVRIITGAKVERIEQESRGVRIWAGENQFFAKKIAVCTNAFAKELLPEIDVVPGRGIVIATKPIRNLKISGTFHYKEGYYYFRDYYGRLIFGGARNLFEAEERTTQIEINPRIYEHLTDMLRNIILPGQNFEIETVWAGIMGFGETNTYELVRSDEHIFAAVRLNGMGVALGTYIGDELSNMLLSELNLVR